MFYTYIETNAEKDMFQRVRVCVGFFFNINNFLLMAEKWSRKSRCLHREATALISYKFEEVKSE